ncbi:MAG: hypothetical protein M1830_000525 [Pleopsidium flavum]|nr:MAG: hypothetical protein M1830_008399 [Pleopsidium flavum]KAI9878568.1 MAG: hypothetical protein M1830_000525 [Pleopsidium flavum]
MQKPFMRIPYTGPLPPPTIVPRNANTPSGAIAALSAFLAAPFTSYQSPTEHDHNAQTVLLTGAGISVASGLADYRGTNGTYTLNKTYRPIYYNEFITNHEARKRYWARSFLGWTNLYKARPNSSHWAVKRLGELGILRSVITQRRSPVKEPKQESSWIFTQLADVDSFHPKAHPDLPTIELHGFLRSLVCVTCHNHLPRATFQESLSSLNPAWAAFLAEMLESGALDTEHPDERRKKGLKTNPDGDVDLPDAPYSTFRYPACPTCLATPPKLVDGTRSIVKVDSDGAWSPTSTAGILKPAVVMFGESIAPAVKAAAEEAIDNAGRLLVVGSSLATYSAWRLVKRAKERGMPIGILNIGGVRGEETFFADVTPANAGQKGVRCSESADKILPVVVGKLQETMGDRTQDARRMSSPAE